MRRPWIEPSLDDLLGDEITRLLMARDRVGVESLRRLLRHVKATRRNASRPRPDHQPAECTGCC
ncbi:MAG TPA: hypothetical protein VLX85_16300 [Stellaceae bacterium]|nr:hypothetical protein [Stellaceae bacterium]